MNRKSIIISLVALALMALGVGVAVAVLYSGDTKPAAKSAVPDQERYLLLPAVPADAVVVACLSDVRKASGSILSGFAFTDSLYVAMKGGKMKSIASSPMTVSLHFSGSLRPLFVFDAGKASPECSEDASELIAMAEGMGMMTDYVDCSSLSGCARDISKRSLVVISDSEALLKSSIRHLEKSISVMDASGFAAASSSVTGKDVLFFSNAHSKMLMTEVLAKKYLSHASFLADFAEWTVAEITKADASGTYLSGTAIHYNDPSEYVNVLAKSQPSVSKVAQMLPSYTVSALSLPMKGVEGYIEAYKTYMDSKQSLQSFRKRHRELETKTGISPEEFFRRIDVKEVARAEFMSGGALSEVNLIKVGKQDTVIFAGTDGKTFKNYVPAVHSWPYASFAASVFGRVFELADESCFTYMDGWIITGSLTAVKEYVEGKTLTYNLVEYMADAGQKDMLAAEASLVYYFSLTENSQGHSDVFTKVFCNALAPFYEDCDYCPAVFTITSEKNRTVLSCQMPRLTMMKTKAPEFERDTTVVIPEGPFRVKNSGTGKMNVFYQNSHGSLCLQEEGGKGLWGVPFDGKLCGTAQNVDYYANGKLQIIFGSDSKIYIIDRLGRFVTGFPIDLGKEILVGPDLYDFNGTRAYNIMVLHKDNTIEMYNLKGRKPSTWKTIIAPETIKGLPERIEVGGNTFWVVRTSIQTMIYPFSGGGALTLFKGDQMIRPDSAVKVLDSTSVSVECYDGQSRTVKLK